VSLRAWRKRAGVDGEALDEMSVPESAPGAGRVLVAVEGAAIDPWTATPPGRVPGLAAVGRVVATGDAAAEWQDARVLVPALAPCGECDRCRRGGAALCPDRAVHGVDGPGALASRLGAAARWLVRLEGPLALPGPAAAALGGELALAYALYARAGVGPREPTVVWGRGAVARAAAAILAAKGAPAHVATDDVATAAALGAAAGPASAEAVTAALAEHDVRRPRRVLVTAPEMLGAALAAAGPRATVVVLTAPGVSGVASPVDLTAVLADEVVVTGVAGCHPDLVPELVALAVRGEVELDALVEVMGLDGLGGGTDGVKTRVVAVPD
jgi:6-hydroxycyclohex-1-ene-1-carbonyl-CoA dehydrogenase